MERNRIVRICAIRVHLFLGSLTALALCQGLSAACGPVMTDRGEVAGSPAGSGCAFKGIPFAQPPTGALRFKPPVPHDPWTGVLSATEYGNRCAQLDANNNVIGAEDCLFLNLWAPAALSDNVPVMVWFTGGFHETTNIGSGGVPLYDGQYFMERFGVIVVTLQFRVNVLGYMVHPALDAENPKNVSGNYGFLDQVAALQWVQQNIAAFGGDPGRVTLFGFSAGGQDVGIHLVSPLSKGLFSAAIISSPWGPLDSAPTVAELEHGIGAQVGGGQVASATGCAGESDLASCLRALPLAELVPAVPIVNAIPAPGAWGPVVDGYAIPAQPLDIINAGLHSQVPVIIGSNAEEAYVNVTPGSIPDEATYSSKLRQIFGNAGGDMVLAQYASLNYESAERAFVTAITDNVFTCPVRRVARALVNSQNAPVFRYELTHTLGSSTPMSQLHAYHTQMLFYIWHNFSVLLPGYTPSASEWVLADAVAAYWARFATDGDPNWFQEVYWPAALSGYDDVYLQLDDEIVVGRGVRTSNCDFWDAHLELSVFRGSKQD